MDTAVKYPLGYQLKECREQVYLGLHTLWLEPIQSSIN